MACRDLRRAPRRASCCGWPCAVVGARRLTRSSSAAPTSQLIPYLGTARQRRSRRASPPAGRSRRGSPLRRVRRGRPSRSRPPAAASSSRGACSLRPAAEQRSRGLMEVTDLQGYYGHGLRVRRPTSTNGFYMRNTPMPAVDRLDRRRPARSCRPPTWRPARTATGCPTYPPAGPYRIGHRGAPGGPRRPGHHRRAPRSPSAAAATRLRLTRRWPSDCHTPWV